MQLMHEDLERLPNAISVEVVQALEPLEQLQQNVQQALENYDVVLAIQRQTLDELAQHMSASAALAIEQRVARLDAIISELSHKLSELKASLDNMEQTAQRVAALSDKPESVAHQLSGCEEKGLGCCRGQCRGQIQRN